jgi:tRNA(fMet)-specific endonuclease VapC
MTLRFLLDTNIVSEPLAAIPHAGVLAKLKRHQDEIALSAPVWHELIFGCRRLPDSPKRRAIAQYLEEVLAVSLPLLPYDREAATWHGQQRARLEKLGQPTPFVDGQIAAIAAVNHLTLVTRNVADFKYFDGLEIENWFLARDR